MLLPDIYLNLPHSLQIPKVMEIIMLIMGVLALSISAVLLFWIGKRRFKRRNFAGLEGFSSYEKSLAIPFLERIGKWLAYALILVGIFFVWIYLSESKRKEAKETNTTTKIEISNE